MTAINTKASKAGFAKRFVEMHNTGKKAAELVHTIGVDVLKHFQSHQDVTLVNAFFTALPPGLNYKAVTLWLMTFAAVRLNNNPATKADEPFAFDKKKATSPDAAANNPWFTMAKADKPVAAVPFDIKAHMIGLVKRAAKAEKLDGDFQALRAAALALGVPESEIPSDTDAALKAKEVKTGTKMAKGKKADKLPETVDPLETATA